MKALFFALVAATLVVFNCTIGESAPKEGLVLYLAFNEGTGKTTKDLSENGNDGQIHDAKWVDGKFGKALEFDGTKAYVEVPNNKSLNITKAVTVEFWINPGGPFTSYSGIVHKGTANADRPNNYDLQTWSGNDKIQLVYSHAGNNNEWHPTDTIFSPNKWYHVAGVIDPLGSKKMSLYVNGELDGEKGVASEEMQLTDNPLWICRRHDAFFNGILDEVVIYNRALTEDEIKQDMKGIKTAVYPSGKLAMSWGIIKKDSAR